MCVYVCVYGVTLLFMHLLVIIKDDYTLAIVNNATVKTGMQVSLWNNDLLLMDLYPEVR